MNALPVEGWYADSEDPSLIRWWDGGQWTSNTRPAPSEEKPEPDPGRAPTLPVIPEPVAPSFDAVPPVEAAPQSSASVPPAPAVAEASETETVARSRRSGHPTPEDYHRRVEELQQGYPPPGAAQGTDDRSWEARNLVNEPPSAFTPPDSPDEGAVIVSSRTQAPENDLLSSMGYVFAVLAPPVGIVVSIALFAKGDERARYVLGVAILFCIIGVLFFL